MGLAVGPRPPRLAHRVLGDGRGGCSASSFDIHGGGIDLVFPHHENEVAQTEAARGEPLARIWMHNGMLQIGGDEKMSKSVGNVRSLAEVLDARRPRGAVLLYFARRPLPPADRVLAASGSSRPQPAASGGSARPRGGCWPGEPSPESLAPHREAFFDALADDFNTARALAALFDWISEANKLEDAPGRPATCARCSRCSGSRACSPARRARRREAIELADRRAAAREARDWAEADRLRDELRSLGWEVRDGPQGPELVAAG